MNNFFVGKVVKVLIFQKYIELVALCTLISTTCDAKSSTCIGHRCWLSSIPSDLIVDSQKHRLSNKAIQEFFTQNTNCTFVSADALTTTSSISYWILGSKGSIIQDIGLKLTERVQLNQWYRFHDSNGKPFIWNDR